MDNFLHRQAVGDTVDSEIGFTLSPEKAREKILHSIPQAPPETVFRLLDAALLDLGYNPTERMYYRAPTDFNLNIELFRVHLTDFGPKRCRALLAELREPFSADRGLRRLAQAVFIAAGSGETVALSFSGAGLSLPKTVRFTSSNLEVPENFQVHAAQHATLEFSPKYTGRRSLNSYPSHLNSLSRKLQIFPRSPESILPMESLIGPVGGYFSGRSNPFTAIRSYARAPVEEQGQAMQCNLWDGPYTQLDTSTIVLNKKREGRFLFLRWRPDYGRPVILHHSLDADLTFGPQTCKGTFLVTTSDEPARIFFLSERIVADPVEVEGPRGTFGMVVWPGLRHDLWGTKLVKDVAFEEAVAWAQTQVNATAA